MLCNMFEFCFQLIWRRSGISKFGKVENGSFDSKMSLISHFSLANEKKYVEKWKERILIKGLCID